LVTFETLGAVSYSLSIVTMTVSVTVCELFSVKEWCNLENKVRVRSRSLEMAPFDRPYEFLFAFHSNYGDILYLFAIYSDLLVENREIILHNLYLAPPQGLTPS